MRYFYRFYRRPRTTQEIRQNLDGFGRAKRNFANLVNAYDDNLRQSFRNHSWKRYRRTQYKVSNKFQIQKKNSSAYAKSMAKRDHFHLDHKRCYWRYQRCTYCRKNQIWKDFDAYHDRRRRREASKRKFELEKWLKELD